MSDPQFACPSNIHELTDESTQIDSLGECTLENPMTSHRFVHPEFRVCIYSDIREITERTEKGLQIPSFERAGPREKIFHDPAWTRAAIVTCGGLCPGLNDVIKGVVQVLWFDYGVRNIFGIPYGYQGLNPRYHHQPIPLNPEAVDTVHEQGGTILGSSRGAQDPQVMVDTLMRLNINMLFCVGGDGTLRGAHAIAEEVKRRQQKISVVGIPKTIDNDLNLVDRTFGFETAVYEAAKIITNAHVEARGAYNGLGIVKLMGRDSGFIAAYASLANSVVNFCIVPEIEFQLEGEHGLLAALEQRFARNKTHAVIVVAEGAGQHLFSSTDIKTDASGNKLHQDIGDLICDRIYDHFKGKEHPVSVKYFDPSYLIRSVSAEGTDAIFCYQLAANAVHAAMAGKHDMLVGSWNGHFTHIPINLATCTRKKIDINGPLWHAVMSATRQKDYGFIGE